MSELESLEVSVALSNISHPVAIITTRSGEKINGMTAAWVAQTSIDPPIVYVSISPLRYTWEMVDGSDHFGVSLLGYGQEEIAEIFGTTSGRDRDKFGILGIEPFIALKDIPLIPSSVVAFVSKKIKCVEIGDHYAVFGEVVEAWKGPDSEPLGWFRSKFKK
jgi:flavin reductase (DIM6/NTAB) family NADH-FMN oxidoreductase RutF